MQLFEKLVPCDFKYNPLVTWPEHPPNSNIQAALKTSAILQNSPQKSIILCIAIL